MPRRLAASALPAAVALAVALGACGSGDDASPTATPSTEPSKPRFFGDHPGQGATALRIDPSDCNELAAAVARQTRRRVRHRSEPTAPNSRCEVEGRGVHVSITLDSAYAARQRYTNRMVEQVQFNAGDPAKVPHEVPRVGDRAVHNHYASWIPAYSTLYAVRGNRWLTIAYSLAAETRSRRLREAAALARESFRLSAR
ncbi:MAG TPA: hypothetical protein VN732_09120 [Solirubrobacterales bacterium]|nr:hypothetical protein [Solirubrobacterales bacterium]